MRFFHTLIPLSQTSIECNSGAKFGLREKAKYLNSGCNSLQHRKLWWTTAYLSASLRGMCDKLRDQVRMLQKICDFLAVQEALAPCDVIAVLAGHVERKSYALKLFNQDLAPRLIWSVARFDVKHTADLLCNGTELISMRDGHPPEQRHFWVDFREGRSTILPAHLKATGTFGELEALAMYLAPEAPLRAALVSTSIHLRRIRFCCSRIALFANRKIYLWAVPESESSFQRSGWWRRRKDSRYLISEYAKLAGYHWLYR